MFLFFKYCADVENCGVCKGFGYIYIDNNNNNNNNNNKPPSCHSYGTSLTSV